jgi:hypothetical protein
MRVDPPHALPAVGRRVFQQSDRLGLRIRPRASRLRRRACVVPGHGSSLENGGHAAGFSARRMAIVIEFSSPLKLTYEVLFGGLYS